MLIGGLHIKVFEDKTEPPAKGASMVVKLTSGKEGSLLSAMEMAELDSFHGLQVELQFKRDRSSSGTGWLMRSRNIRVPNIKLTEVT